LQKIKQKEKCGRHSDKNAAGAALQKSVWHAQYRRKKIGKAITSGKKNKHYRHKSKNEIPNQKKANFKQNKKKGRNSASRQTKKKNNYGIPRKTKKNSSSHFLAQSGDLDGCFISVWCVFRCTPL